MEEEVPAMIVWGCEVKVVTAVTVEARQPSPKSPWSKVKKGGFLHRGTGRVCTSRDPWNFSAYYPTLYTCKKKLKVMNGAEGSFLHVTCSFLT